MQLSEIKTVEQAKALAFDAIQRIEIEQNNLRALQQRNNMAIHTIKLRVKAKTKKTMGLRLKIAALLIMLAEKVGKTSIDVAITKE